MRLSFSLRPAALLSKRLATCWQRAGTLLSTLLTARVNQRIDELDAHLADLEAAVHVLVEVNRARERRESGEPATDWPPPGYPPSRRRGLHVVRALAALAVWPCARSPPPGAPSCEPASGSAVLSATETAAG